MHKLSTGIVPQSPFKTYNINVIIITLDMLLLSTPQEEIMSMFIELLFFKVFYME